MKTNKIISLTLGVAVTALLSVSCSDSFLDTSSKTDLNSGSFYKNPLQAEYALTGCYDGYQRTVSNGSWPTMFQAAEMMSDDCLGGGGPDDRANRLLDRFDMSIRSDNTSMFDGIWQDYYAGIYRCNMLISQLDNITWESEDQRNTIEGEARAIRGLEYFDLVRMFENVPLLTEPTNEIVPQSPYDDVYAQIVTDLKFAADNIPAGAYDPSNEATFGHITRYAAAAMLARVYLFYDGVYNDNAGAEMPGGLTKAQALQYCEDVIGSQLYGLEEEFNNLWPAACTEATSPAEGRQTTYVEASKEILWVVKFNNDNTYNSDNPGSNGNKFIVNFGLRNEADGTYAPYGNGWGAAPVTPYAQGLFGNNDKRKDATVIDCKAIGSFDSQSTSDVMDYTGYVNKKYCPLIFNDGTSMPFYETEATGGDFQTAQDQNWVLMRYADVLLMAAELGSTNAMAYFNLVRERAYGDSNHDIDAVPTREQIWKERRLEFMGEGIRYFDLRRQGIDAFVTAMMGQANSNGSTTGTPVTVYNNGVAGSVTDEYVDGNIRTKRGFWQIPYNQITLSGNVYKQNAGW